MYLKCLCILSWVLVTAGMDEDQDYFDKLLNEPVDRSHWVDPFDMDFVDRKKKADWIDPFAVDFDRKDDRKKEFCDSQCKACQDKLALTAHELEDCQKQVRLLQETTSRREDNKSKVTTVTRKNEPAEKKKVEKSCDEVYFRRHVTLLMDRLGLSGEPEAKHLKVEVYLTENEVKTLQKFRERSSSGDIYDVDHIVANMIKSKELFTPPVYHFWENVKEVSRDIRDPLIVLCLVVCLAYVLVFSTRYFSIRKILFVFCIGCVGWHWLHMYKKAWAVKKSKLMAHTHDLPAECRPDQMTWSQTISVSVKGWFSRSDKCLQFHEALLIDPIYEVNPVMALAELITGLLFTPVRKLGKEFGESFSGLLDVVPAAWQPIILALFVLLILFCLVLIAGYKIHLPFFFELSPANTNNIGISREEMMELKMSIKEISRVRGTTCEEQHHLRIRANHAGFDCLDNGVTRTSGVQDIKFRRSVSESAKDSPYLTAKTQVEEKDCKKVMLETELSSEKYRKSSSETGVAENHVDEPVSSSMENQLSRIEELSSAEIVLTDDSEERVPHHVDVDDDPVDLPAAPGSEAQSSPPSAPSRPDPDNFSSPRSKIFMSKVVQVLDLDNSK